MTNKAEQVLSGASHKKMGAAKVLVVIDKYIAGKTFKKMLEEWNYHITGVCAAGKEALIKARENKPDLILTDVELKDCNGIRLVKQLNLQPDQSNLGIYFTAYATDLIVQRTLNAASALGYSIKSPTDKFARNFEASFCRYFGIDQTTIYSKKKESATKPIQVLLVDDQQIVLWGLEKLIGNEQPAMEVVATATNISDAKQRVMEKQPDIVVLNISLGDEDCINLIPEFTHNGNTRVVIFTETHDKEIIDRAVLSGARGVVHKKEPMHTIVRAIEKIHDGELWLDRITTGRIFLQNSRFRGKMAHDPDAEKISTLTRKECMILRAFSDGVGGEQNKQIAAKLCMSEHTLRNHLTSIFSKLGIKNRFSLFAYAKQHFQQPVGLPDPSKLPFESFSR
ncbi:response regulator [Nitrosomonas sp. JL21]|uniref:response regulator transcription factor n=1 Tax=Nitrosomonas sp. JL21 TaxID=153949 RepID=UPI00136B0762|nr:DNA-binding response regulator [Nitrosomonas sp. JL21]MBL8498009.1 response regulator [Nitrosomonas sp.]MCC7090384.1 response regulator [Nitrosomonas sp.]MXS78751.1 response regulator [Nitrosomonas sp. JL21]